MTSIVRRDGRTTASGSSAPIWRMRTAPSSPAVATRAWPGLPRDRVDRALVDRAPHDRMTVVGAPHFDDAGRGGDRQLAPPVPHAIARGYSPTSTRQPWACAVGSVAPTTAAIRAALGRCCGGQSRVGRAGAAAERAIDRVAPDVQQLIERQVAVAGAADARGAVDPAQPALHLGDLARRHHVGLVHDQHVGEGDLLVRAGLPLRVQRQQPPIDQHRQAVEPEAALDLLVHQERAHDRAGVGGPVASIRMRSYCWRRRVTLTSARIRSPRTVPHTRPSSISKISSSVAIDRRAFDGHLAELVLDDEDRAGRSPLTMRLISVVFPAPMAPARTVTGILGVMKAHMI